MGWANCGDDSQGRPIGYGYEATCDYPGCEVEIDRGLAYACGNMHGETEYSCEGYFCQEHLEYTPLEIPDYLHPWEEVFCPECIELHKELKAEENAISTDQ